MKRSAYAGSAGVLGAGVVSSVAPIIFDAQSRASGPLQYPIPDDGLYRIYQWGMAGNGGLWSDGTYAGRTAPGGTGALTVTDVQLTAGQVLSISVPFSAGDTVVVLPNARTITAGRGGNATLQGDGTYLPGLAGIASGGDININGSASTSVPTTFGTQTAPDGGGTNPGKGGVDGGRDTPNKVRYAGGPGAPGYDEFKGGDGASYFLSDGAWTQSNRATLPGGAPSESNAVANGHMIYGRVILKRIG